MFAGSPFGVIAALVFVALLVIACTSDVRARRIPNQIVSVLALAGVGYSAVRLGIVPGIIFAAAGLGVGLAIWMPFHVIRLLGAGDVKLFAASAAWLGVSGALEASLFAAVAGGLLALIWMLRTRGVAESARALGAAVTTPGAVIAAHDERVAPDARLPYGIALAVGAAVVAFWPGLLLGY